MGNKKHYIFSIKPIVSNDGNLTVVEEKRDIPFEIKRVFYEYGLKKGTVKGNHANKNSKFCMVAVEGFCNVVVDDGNSKASYLLDNPNKFLFIENMVWKTMTNFSSGCILVVFSDSYYDKTEYIYNYSDFLELVKALK